MARTATVIFSDPLTGNRRPFVFSQAPLCSATLGRETLEAGEFGGPAFIPFTSEGALRCTPGATTDSFWIQARTSPEGLAVWIAPNLNTHVRLGRVVVGDRTLLVSQQPSSEPDWDRRSGHALWFGLFGWTRYTNVEPNALADLIYGPGNNLNRAIVAALLLNGFYPTLDEWQFWRDTIAYGRLTMADLIRTVRASPAYQCAPVPGKIDCLLTFIAGGSLTESRVRAVDGLDPVGVAAKLLTEGPLTAGFRRRLAALRGVPIPHTRPYRTSLHGCPSHLR